MLRHYSLSRNYHLYDIKMSKSKDSSVKAKVKVNMILSRNEPGLMAAIGTAQLRSCSRAS